MARRRGHDGVYLIDRNANMTELVSEALANCATTESTAHFRMNNSWDAGFEQAEISVNGLILPDNSSLYPS